MGIPSLSPKVWKLLIDCQNKEVARDKAGQGLSVGEGRGADPTKRAWQSGLEEDKTDFDAGLTLIANTLLNAYCEPQISKCFICKVTTL